MTKQLSCIVVLMLLAFAPRADAQKFASDARGVRVSAPTAGSQIRQFTTFHPAGVFLGEPWGLDMINVPARVQIRRCSDWTLAFQADSIIPFLHGDSSLVQFTFPTSRGSYDVRKLLPGCYTIAVIARYPADGDRSNDTAASTSFSITSDTLMHDVGLDSILSPHLLSVQPNVAVPIIIRCSNTGRSNEATVPVTARIRDYRGNIVYEDSTIVPATLVSGQTQLVHFRSFTPTASGTYSLLATIHLATDQLDYNDTLSSTLYVGGRQVVPQAILSPTDGEVMPYGAPIRVSSKFRYTGSAYEIDDAQVRAELYDSVGEVVSFGDTTIPRLSYDNPLEIVSWSANAQGYFLGFPSVPPGNYRLVVASFGNDPLPSVDTIGKPISVQLRTDIRVDSASPPSYSVDSLRTASLAVLLHATNYGLDPADSQTITLMIYDDSGQLVFDASVIETRWLSSESRTLAFPSFLPVRRGWYSADLLVPNSDGWMFDRGIYRYYTWYYDPSSASVAQTERKPLVASAFPNPLTRGTSIRLVLSEQSPVRISIRNLLGTEVAVVCDKVLEAGEYSFPWDAAGLPSGVYECVVQIEGVASQLPLVLAR